MSLTTLLLLLVAETGVDAGVAGATVDAGPRPVEAPSEADAAPAENPDFQVTARVEPDPVPFGDVVDLVVTLTRPPRKRITLPALDGSDLEPSETLPRIGEVRREARELPPDPERGDRVQEVLRFSFLALDVKDLRTPPFILKSDDGTVLQVPALPVRVDVKPVEDHVDGGVPPGALVLDAAAEQLTYRVRDDRPWIALAAVAVAAAVVLVARWIARSRQKKRAAMGPPPVPPRPAHEVALERLDALLPLLQQGEVTSFVEKMMDEVLRDYLAGRFALAAGTRTTREIVTDLLAVTTTNLDVTLVEEVGKDADLVKFARAHLAASQAHAMAGRVRALIIATAERSGPSSPAPSSTTGTAAP